MAKAKKTASPATAKAPRTKTQRARATKTRATATDSQAKVKTSTPAATTASGNELCVFAIRLKRLERDAIHAAAGPGKATQFVRGLSVAAARKDKAAIAKLLESVVTSS